MTDAVGCAAEAVVTRGADRRSVDVLFEYRAVQNYGMKDTCYSRQPNAPLPESELREFGWVILYGFQL